MALLSFLKEQPRLKIMLLKGCSSLTNINIPNSVTEIRRGAFEGCKLLTVINVPAKMSDYYKKLLSKNIHHLIEEIEAK